MRRGKFSTVGREAGGRARHTFSMNHFVDSTRLFLVAAFGLLAACSTISTFDQAAYEHATSAKVDALAVMSKATGDFSQYEKEVEALNLTLSKAYEYDRGRPLNQITIALWDKLLNPSRDLLGGFLREWKTDGPMLPKYVANKKEQIGQAFDILIGLESGKLKPSEAANKL